MSRLDQCGVSSPGAAFAATRRGVTVRSPDRKSHHRIAAHDSQKPVDAFSAAPKGQNAQAGSAESGRGILAARGRWQGSNAVTQAASTTRRVSIPRQSRGL